MLPAAFCLAAAALTAHLAATEEGIEGWWAFLRAFVANEIFFFGKLVLGF